jgi:hypothetical protein
MTAVLADLREFARPLSAFAAFQQCHFFFRRIHFLIEIDKTRADETAGDPDLILIRAAPPR